MFDEEASFSIFLPQKKETILADTKQCLDVVNFCQQFLYEMREMVTKFFFEKSFEYFDPHVGDTACQIRAHILFFLYQEHQHTLILDYRSYLSMLDERLSRLEQLSEPAILKHYYAKHRKLADFISAIGVDIKLRKDVLILTLCYFFTKYKVQGKADNTAISPSTIMMNYACSRKKAKKLIHHLQKLLAAYSCKYIFFIARQIGYCDKRTAVLNALKRLDDDGRLVLPCYFSMEVLLTYMVAHHWPILLNIARYSKFSIDSLTMLFEVSARTNCYEGTINKRLCGLDAPAYIIDVVSIEKGDKPESAELYGQRLNRSNIIDLILGYMAAHPQYSGTRLSHLAQNPLQAFKLNSIESVYETATSHDVFISALEEELSSRRNYADTKGCSNENKRLFFVHHISCQNINRASNAIVGQTNILATKEEITGIVD